MDTFYLHNHRANDPFYLPEEKRKMRKKEAETRLKNKKARKKRKKTFGRTK